jgi:hypothetical protein
VQNGGIVLVPASSSLPVVPLVETGAGNPFHFTSIAVGATTVTLVGTINLQSLLGL